jgi:hypothetical protein
VSYAQTLILNQSYRPHEIIDWKEAVTRMVNGKIQVIAQYDEILASIDRRTLQSFPELKVSLRSVVGTDVDRIDIMVPAVAVLLKAIKPVKVGKHIKFSKINVCLRDKFSCQYCGDRLKMSELQYEHVVPRSQGGKRTCNSFKANRTPEEAGMTLLSVPVKPKVLPMNEPMIYPETAPEEWRPYLVA